MNAIFGQRLKSARIQAGLSQDELVERIGNLVSKNAISKYERGEMMANSRVIVALARALGIKTEYFFQAFTVNINQFSFRKKSRLSVRDLNSIKHKIADQIERYLEVEEFLNITNDFGNPIKDFPVSDPRDIEDAAKLLLNDWHLGWNALPGIIDMLEDKGIKVLEIDAPLAFDGLSGYANVKIPFLVINKNYSVERKRLTALHELGHLLLNFKKQFLPVEIEKLCFRFAGAMLIPDVTLKQELGNHRNHVTFQELMAIKETYGISIQAIMARARDLEIISDTKYRNFCISINKNKSEEGLGSYPGKEQAGRFKRLLFRAAAEEIVSLSKAANLGGMKLAEFRNEFLLAL